MNYAKLFMSLGIVAALGALAVGGTTALYGDVESSTGNTFTAGDVDLQIGNESYYSALNPSFDGTSDSLLPENEQNTFSVGDLDEGQVFFAFNDLKPGDLSEDTITMRVDTNDSYMCAYLETTADDDGTCNEPELDDDPSCVEGNADEFDGELGEALNFAFWVDDGDNVFEDDETVVMTGNAASAQNGLAYALADTDTADLFGDNGNVLEGGEEYHIGKAWCFGALTADNTTALPSTDAGEELDGGPDTRGSGVACDAGTTVDNASQTDVVEGIVAFYAVQERNNAGFTCDAALFADIGNDAEDLPTAGAQELAGFADTVPSECDYTVDEDATETGTTFNTITAAVAAASDGDTICVEDGTYNEFAVNKELTIAGLTNPLTGTAVVQPSAANVDALVDITASNVTVTGLKLDGSNVEFTANQVAGFKMSGGDLTNVTITHNVVEELRIADSTLGESAPNPSVKGIQWYTSTPQGYTLSNSTFAYNVIRGMQSKERGGYGVQTVGALDTLTIAHNTISDIDGAYGAGVALDALDPVSTADVVVRNNEITEDIWSAPEFSDGALSVQVEHNVDQTGITITENNIEGMVHGGGPAGAATGDEVNAERNWWGDTDPSDNVFGPIDYTPYLTSPFPTS